MNPAQSIAENAAELVRSHPHASASDILELVMQGNEGMDLDFRDSSVPHGSHAWPTTPLGQLIAAVFDHGMHPSDWQLVDRCDDPKVVECLLVIWKNDVLPKFAAHFNISAVAG